MLGNKPLNHWKNIHHDKLYSSKGDWRSTDQKMSVNIFYGGCLSNLFSLYNGWRVSGLHRSTDLLGYFFQTK